MSSIDTRVVEMQFDNKKFGSGVKDSLNDLKNLKEGLKLDGATKGLEDVEAKAGRFNLGPIGNAAEAVGQKFSAMAVMGITALANLTNKVVNSATEMTKSLTIAPLTSGFSEYELMMGSIQTILSNTARYGTTLPDVTKNLDALNTYADKTIYSFSDMTKNIGLFTNAGIRIEDATSMIKGFSNEAAASGTNAEGAAGAAYQLSQALSAGTIRLMDWRSLQNVGMGNKNMQNGLIDLAKSMGAFTGTGTDATKAQKDFNGSLEKGWLSADVMSNYLKIMAGDMTDAQMKQLGLTQTQIDGFKKQQAMSQDAATKVRTWTQLIGTVREAVGSGWTESFRTIFGDFEEATDLFTGLNNVISGIVGNSADARNKMLADWKALGGRTALIDGLKAAWQALSGVLGPIHDAFRELFPPKTGQDLMNMTTAFKNFMQSLIPSQKTMDGIKRTFAGFFAVLKIGWLLIKAGVNFITELIGHFAKGGGSVLGFTAKIGDWLVKLEQAIEKGDLFNKFFQKLAHYIELPVDKLKDFIKHIVDFVKAIASSETAQAIIERWKKNFDQMGEAGDKVGNAWEKTKQVFSAMWKAVEPVVKKIGEVFKDIAKGVGDFISSISFTDLMAGAGIGAFILLVNKIRSTIDNLFNKKDKGPGVMDKVKEALEGLTGTLKAMQQTLKATAILEIAAAIAILTIAVSVLSKIDAAGLATATAAITAMLIQLTGTLVVMDKMMKKAKGMKLDMIAAAMILVAIAIDILASAVKKLADLSWNDLAKGMTGTVVLLGALVGVMKLMPDDKKMFASAAGILIIAGAVKLLVSSVKDIADMSWAQLAEGMTGVAALLTSLALFTKFSKMTDVGDGLGILLISAAIKVLASAMKDISDLSWANLAEGLVGIAGALGVLVAAIQKLPTKIVFDSAGVLLIAASLKIIASAMKDFADMSWANLGEAVTAMALSLGIIVLAMKGLDDPKMLLGAAALVIASAALKILASALSDMGGMSWADIGAALAVLAGSLLILGIGLIAMGDPLVLLGAAGLVAGAFGVKILAEAMQSLGSMSWSDIGAALGALAGGLLILAVGLTAMAVTLPGSAGLAAAGPGLRALAEVMGSLGGMSWADIGAALVALTGGLLALAIGLTAMIVALPGAGALALAAPGLGALADAMKKAGGMSWSDIAAGIVAIGGALVALAVGLTAMIASLPGAAALAVAAPALGDLASAMKKIGAMSWSDIAAAAGGIASFLSALAVGGDTTGPISRLADALVKLAPALQKSIDAVKGAGNAGDNAKAIAAGLKELAAVDADSLSKIATAADKLSKALPNLQAAVATGLGSNASDVVKAGADLANNFATGITGNTTPATNAGATLVNKVRDAINTSIPGVATSVSTNAQSIGANIVSGVNRGVDNNKASLTTKMQKMATDALNAAKQALGIHSPSKKFQEIGNYVVEGFALGLAGHPEKVESAVDNLVDNLMGKFDDAMQSNLDDIQKHQDKIGDLQGQIQNNAENIAAAQADLNDAINTPITKSKAKKLADRRAADAKAEAARQNKIRDAQKKLSDLVEKQNQYNQAIWNEQAAINQDSDEYWKLNAARATLANQLADEQAKLNDLTQARDDNNQAIEDEQKVLEDAIRTRDDYNNSLRDQYGTQEDISKETKVSDYVKDLQNQIVATQQFTTAIQELRKRGLNDELYKMLLAKGPTDGMPFVQQLLDGGQEQLDDLNYLGDALDKAAGDLGDQASGSLYQAGVDAADGILKGLQSKATDIQAQMDAIAQYMVTALNNALGIHSPSRVMAEIGAYSVMGLAKGLKDSAPMIEKASAAAGQTAIDSMKKTISGLGAMVGDSMDVNPTIAPVLDLSAVKKDASIIGDLLSAPALSVGSAYSNASEVAAAYAANQLALTEAYDPANMPAPMIFNQTNNSPRALSQAEIYRQTNNQLSVAKGALTSNARSS